MDFDPSHATADQRAAIVEGCGYSDAAANSHVFIVLSCMRDALMNGRFGSTKRAAKAARNVQGFRYDGWLVVYRYTKPADIEIIMRHHLWYNVGCRDGPHNYQGEPPADFEFTWPPDHREPPTYCDIDLNFCGLRGTNWHQLLGETLPPKARHFSKESENLYLIETVKHVYVVNYEYT